MYAGQAQARRSPATAPSLHSTLDAALESPPRAIQFTMENENPIAGKPGELPPPSGYTPGMDTLLWEYPPV